MSETGRDRALSRSGASGFTLLKDAAAKQGNERPGTNSFMAKLAVSLLRKELVGTELQERCFGFRPFERRSAKQGNERLGTNSSRQSWRCHSIGTGRSVVHVGLAQPLNFYWRVMEAPPMFESVRIRKAYLINLILALLACASWAIYLIKPHLFVVGSGKEQAFRFLGQDLPKDITEVQLVVQNAAGIKQEVFPQLVGKKLGPDEIERLHSYITFNLLLLSATRTESVDQWQKIGKVTVQTRENPESLQLTLYGDSLGGLGFEYGGSFYKADRRDVGKILDLIRDIQNSSNYNVL